MSLRVGSPNPVSAREAWVELQRTAVIAGAHGDLFPGVLRHAAMQASRIGFPIPGVSAQLAAGALKDLALAFDAAGTEARITAISPALAAAARCVDAFLDEPAIEAASRDRVRMGERD